MYQVVEQGGGTVVWHGVNFVSRIHTIQKVFWPLKVIIQIVLCDSEQLS